MKNQVNLNFHQTFKPEKKYISSILDIADNAEMLSVQEISAYTGIPNGTSSGKVEPHILYASYMGLIVYEKKNGKYTLKKTNLGQVIIEEDPGFKEKLTVLLCHAMLLRNQNGADLWNDIFLKELPLYRGKIKRELVLKAAQNELSEKATTRSIAPFFSSYEDIFYELGVLDIDKEYITVRPLQYNKEYIYLYAFLLFEYWDEQFADVDEISEQQLEELRFRHIFGWTQQQEYEILEHLSDKNIIRLNRQLVPYTIRKLVDKDFVLNNLYSELC